ncbi:MAG: RNA methyltransferase [Bacteroidetes bacterium]|nr:RNA methyltransferase [Bacteroidota bacterium]
MELEPLQGLSKNQIKHIKSLGLKKFRDSHKLFIAEGRKVLAELFASDFKIAQCYLLSLVDNAPMQAVLVDQKALERISLLRQPHYGLAVVHMPQEPPPLPGPMHLVLDGISDPGNLGSIIRLADWYGLNRIDCINNCVDTYNPKVVQASMGSVFRVAVVHHAQAHTVPWNPLVVGAFLNGTSIYEPLPMAQGYSLVIGGEHNGIGTEVAAHCHHKITIPRRGSAESLNAAVATGIILDRLVPLHEGLNTFGPI